MTIHKATCQFDAMHRRAAVVCLGYRLLGEVFSFWKPNYGSVAIDRCLLMLKPQSDFVFAPPILIFHGFRWLPYLERTYLSVSEPLPLVRQHISGDSVFWQVK